MERNSRIALVTCPGGEPLAHQIDKYLHSVLDPDQSELDSFVIPCQHTRFANGEFKSSIESSIRGKDVFLIQDVTNSELVYFNGNGESYELSINDHLFMLFLTLDAIRASGAAQISVILPYFPYSRQHRRKGREALAAARVAAQLENLGADRIITLDIHCKEIENAFRNTNLENLHASYQILKELLQKIPSRKDLMIVSPDLGGLPRNRFFANALGCPLAAIYKERDYSRPSNDANNSNIINMKLLGEVKDRIVFIADDILDTGGTLITAMKILKRHGAKMVLLGISLPLFNHDAIFHLQKAHEEHLFSYIIGTNGVQPKQLIQGKEWYIEADVSELFGQVIDRIIHNRSVSHVLDNRESILQLLSR